MNGALVPLRVAQNVSEVLPVDGVEHPHEGQRVVLCKVPRPWMDGHHLQEHRRLRRDQLARAFCGEVALVPPVGPQDRLADPILGPERREQIDPVRLGVVKIPALDKVHPRGHVAPLEHLLPLRQGVVLEHAVADPVHDRRHVHVDGEEEGVVQKVRGVHLMQHLALQRLGQAREDPYAAFLDEAVLHLLLVHEILEDAPRELVRHVALPQEAAQQPELLHLVSLHVPEACRRT
mmetsp:Transcript_102167/g.304963  ORF Transcript_102167/g.304963 Transcript_102167/m.304963 type:complete len:234 (-) Transcript_102167:1290-1991(-)